MPRFLRTIQLDVSDRQVYHRAAAPGEWAVPGGFALWDAAPDQHDRKAEQAFRHGFVGTDSFGHSTLVVTTEIEPAELERVRARIAQHLVEALGAPSTADALPIAEDEIRFTLELCSHPPGTIIAVERSFGADGVEEQFRVVRPNAGDHEQVRLWALVDE